MGKFIDLTGQKFGRLMVIECAGRDKRGRAIWKCKCDCGNEAIKGSDRLIRGITQSCGCLHTERTRQANTRHGLTHTRLFNIWSGMRKRCYNSNCHAYKDYGGRGITISEEWNDFITFKDWALTHGYDNNLTIDRKDVNGNYEPSNCRWATMKVQSNNTRTNRIITFNGKTQTMKEWANELNINYQTLSTHINRDKWNVVKALTCAII